MDRNALLTVVRRADALAALDDEPLAPRDLVDELDVSRSTVQRAADQLADHGLVERSNGELALTPVGSLVAEELLAFRQCLDAAWRLEGALAAFRATDFDFPVAAFADAAVTDAAPGDPYRPVERFMELVADTGSLRGVDPASINPLHLDDLHAAVVDGMETTAVFRPDVVRELVRNNPDRARSAFESGNLALYTHPDLRFGLTLCDDRVGVGVYDAETGMLEQYVDTDDADAYAWGERVYESVLADATRFDWRDALAD
ncbi:helix-turn-helix transcriptional regulator [Halobacterium yunchengense]|uniref:helix-turn-helix transcriptional regulator n=1 Tax=Halobacterium yunchengense TaxID=3108497 RepID=UPI003009DD2F